MTLKRKNQEMLILELSWMRQVMWKYASTELSRPLNNESTTRQVIRFQSLKTSFLKI